MVFSLISTSLYTMQDTLIKDEETCLICQETFKGADPRVTCVSDHQHPYHRECIFTWLRGKNNPQSTCLMCHDLLFTEEDLAKMCVQDIVYLYKKGIISYYCFVAKDLENMSAKDILYVFDNGLTDEWIYWYFTDDRLAKMSGQDIMYLIKTGYLVKYRVTDDMFTKISVEDIVDLYRKKLIGKYDLTDDRLAKRSAKDIAYLKMSGLIDTYHFTDDRLATMSVHDIVCLKENGLIRTYHFTDDRLATMSVDDIVCLKNNGLIHTYHFTDDRLSKMSLDELRRLDNNNLIDDSYYIERLKTSHIIYCYPLFELIQNIRKEILGIMKKYPTLQYHDDLLDFDLPYYYYYPNDLWNVIELIIRTDNHNLDRPFFLKTPWGNASLIPTYDCKSTTAPNQTYLVSDQVMRKTKFKEEKLHLIVEVETWINDTFDMQKLTSHIRDKEDYEVNKIHNIPLNTLMPKNTQTCDVENSQRTQALAFLMKKYELHNSRSPESQPSKKKKM